MSLKYKGNVAYDIALFEDRTAVRGNRVLKLPRSKLRKDLVKLKKVSLRFKVLAFFTFFVVTLSMMIFNQIQLTELTDKIRQKSEELDAKKSYHTQLEVKHSKNYSTQALEDYAKNKLNMHKTDASKLEYINLHK